MHVVCACVCARVCMCGCVWIWQDWLALCPAIVLILKWMSIAGCRHFSWWAPVMCRCHCLMERDGSTLVYFVFFFFPDQGCANALPCSKLLHDCCVLSVAPSYFVSCFCSVNSESYALWPGLLEASADWLALLVLMQKACAVLDTTAAVLGFFDVQDFSSNLHLDWQIQFPD